MVEHLQDGRAMPTPFYRGDSISVAADDPFNRIGVYDYVDEYWHYYEMNSTPGESVNITAYLEPYTDYVILSVLTILKTRLVVLDAVLCVFGITGCRKPVSSFITKFRLFGNSR